MSKNFSVGIIGTGFGKKIGLNFKAVDPSIKVYFAGRDQQKLDEAVREVGANGSFSNWQEMVNGDQIDLVVIASSNNLHKEMFELAIKANKHILIEKPAALFSSEIEDMERLLLKDKITVVNHEGRFHPVVSYIKDSIKSGKLGDILTIRIGAYLNRFSDPDYKESWINDKNLGGGQIYAIGSHQIDLVRYLLESPEIVSGSVQDLVYQDLRFTNIATAESQFSAHFKTKSGTSIQIFNDCYCFGYKDFIIEIIGSKGIIIYSDQRGLKASFSNSEPLKDIEWADSLADIKLGNSILTKSMKYVAKALVDALKENKIDNRFATLKDEKENLKLFERYR